MAGRRDDGTRDHLPASEAHPAPTARRSTLHTAGLLVGLLLAVGATAAVLVTDDARHLRVALLAACWAFLVAAHLAGGRRADRLAAEGREAELRHAYELELEREVAARATYERQLEQRFRREAEEGMRRELAQWRRELAGLADLRGDVAALGRLRGELAGLGELRDDLGRIRSELSEQLSGELLVERMVMRAQAVRLPAERSDHGRELDGVASTGDPTSGPWTQQTTVERWTESRDEAPLSPSAVGSTALAGASGAPGARRPPPPPVRSIRRLVQADDAPAAGGEDARRPPAVPSSPPGEEPTWQPSGSPSWPPSEGRRPWTPSSIQPSSAQPPSAQPSSDLPASALSSAAPGIPGPTPRSRHRVGLDAAPAGQGDAAAPRRHRRSAEPDGDDRAAGSTPPDDLTPVHPPAPVTPAGASALAGAGAPEDRWWDTPAWSGSPVEDPGEPLRSPAAPAGPGAPREPAAGVPAGAAGGHARLEQILAESGLSPAPGRRRRRHRDDDAAEPAADVLARVLGRE